MQVRRGQRTRHMEVRGHQVTGASVAQSSQPTHGMPTFGSTVPAQSVALVSVFNWLRWLLYIFIVPYKYGCVQ